MGRPTTHSGIKYARPGEGLSRLPTGGQVMLFKAGAALNIGDIVYISAADTVNKSAVAGTFDRKLVGVVVGGKNNDNVIAETASEVGVAAAAANEDVLVMVEGVTFVKADGIIAVGDPFTASTTTAGKATAAADLTIASGAVAVTSTAANGNIIAGAGRSKIVGKMLEAAAADNDVKKVWVHVH